MKSHLILLLPGVLTACGQNLPEYYDGTPPEVSSVSEDGEDGNTGGAVVEIEGSGFGDDLDAITVVFGHNNAEILDVSDSSIEVVVPRGPLEAGQVDIRVGTPDGQGVLEDGYTYDAGGDEGDDWYDDQVAYLTMTNDFRSCYGGIGSTLDPFCNDSAWTGQTGISGKAEFLTYAFPRVHTLYTGERGGYGTSSDWSWGEWSVQKPTQDFVGIDIESAYEDYRVEIDSFSVTSKRFKSDEFYVDESNLASYWYMGGDDVTDDDGNQSMADPYAVTTGVSLIEEAAKEEWDEDWVTEYDAGEMNFCMVPDYDEPRTFEYEPDWPVGIDWFRGADNGEGPTTISLDIGDVGIEDLDLILPPGRPFAATLGTEGDEVEWALMQPTTTCADSDGDNVTELDDAVWRFEWIPFDEDEYADGGQILGARSYVRLNINILNIGWYGGWGQPIRASVTVPDWNDYDDATGTSSVDVPVEVMYQFPTSKYAAGQQTSGDGGSSYIWADPSQTNYQYMVFSLERVTEYKLAVGYTHERDGDVDGSMIVSYASGDLGFLEFNNPLEQTSCGNCLDDDGDGWTDSEDPDCAEYDPDDLENIVEEDDSFYGDYSCNDGRDNDGDGLRDANDPDCLDGYGSETNCGDEIDNDEDGWTDAEDPECSEENGLEQGLDDDYSCANGLDDDGDTWIDADDPDCEDGLSEEVGTGDTECNDGIDNDGHGDVDGEDFTCARFSAFYTFEQREMDGECIDGIDNDGDTYVDANDPDCETPPFDAEYDDGFGPTEYTLVPVCYNFFDDDGDGWIDFEDPGCVNDDGDPDGFVSDENSAIPGYTTCEDGEDNDGDGWMDDLDADCVDDAGNLEDDSTSSGDFQCDDDADNDGDSLIDELDPECEAGWDDDESA